MSRNLMKKTLAGIFALVIVASSTPIAPFVPVMNSNSITASAETASETDFEFDASSGTITRYYRAGGDVEIPSTIGGVAVTSIGDSAFEKCSNLTSVTIPEGVTSIGEYAFFDCESLTSVTIPESVTSIGDCAFEYCSSLTSVTIPEGVTSIGAWAFSDCCDLASVTIPEGVTSIGKAAFMNCKSLASVTIPEGVTSIGDYAFSYCSSLTSVTILEGVTSIGECAFYDCASLASVTIPEGVTSIGARAFSRCSSLTSVTIPEGVTSIGECAFSYCSSLTSVTILEGVTSIGDCAFDDCASLTSITAPCTLKNSMSGAMGNCKAEITYTHKYSKNGYVITCTAGGETFDYTDVFAALDDYDGSNESNYTADSWEDYSDAAAAIKTLTDNFGKDVFVSSQAELTAALSAYNDTKDALEEKPQYETLYENYLVKAPTVNETGTYNKRAYHYENDTKVIDEDRVFTDDQAVTFEQWYLRTLIQYQTNGSEFDLRFVSMLDENLDQYQKAGFIFTINGTEVSDELSTVTANTSYIVDGSKVDISAFSQPDDYFFLQKYVFDIGEIDLDATLAVTAYVVLADGTELRGTKAVTFTLRQFEG